MNAQKRLMILLLVLSILLPACGSAPAETVPPTQAAPAATEAPTEAPEEAATEPTEPEGPVVSEVVFPETDAATGTLKLYINGQAVYAGGPVSDLLNAGVTSYDDLDQILQPWHISSVMRVRVEMEGVKEKDLPFVFFLAINASDEAKMLHQCQLYSLTINTDKGVAFGSGNEETPFITGQTTLEEMTAAYGEPDYSESRKQEYAEIAYYEPFNCAYFSFKNGVVRQIYTYYSANIHGHLAEDFDHEFQNSYFGNDCYILMNQYMDVMPYLLAEETKVITPRVDETGEKRMEPLQPVAVEGAGIVEKLTERITLGGEEMELGISVMDMPELFGSQFWDQLMPVHAMRYVRVGRNNPEEFYFIYLGKGYSEVANVLNLKGVMTRNRNYENWGKECGDFHGFSYENLTDASTIDDVLEQYGLPLELRCTSYARGCFAWMHYEDQAGNTLRICVDPMLNQLIELRVAKYYEGEIYYP